ncbi:hypothetical protein DV738_g3462, partial [Chaetothyriales sp. CBS 135597]
MAEIELSAKEPNAVSVNQASEDGGSVVLPASEWAELDNDVKVGFTTHDQRDMQRMGKKQQFRVKKLQDLDCNWIHKLCDGAPTAGGQYHWVSEFAPRKYQKLLSYVSGSDSVAHMSEEIENAGVIVPKTMLWSFFVNIPLTYLLLLTFLFCIGNLDEALDSPTGFPFIYAFNNATKSVSASTGLTFIILLLLFFITISSMASASRQTFAFARDNGLPFAAWLGHVHPSLHIPVNAVILSVSYAMALSLINIGSSTAFNAILSLSTVALMSTYILSIACIISRRFSGQPLPPSRWTLGRMGLPINIAAMVYTTWGFFWSFWPNSYHVDAATFNWACVLFFGLMSISTVLYLIYARKIYEGPVAKPQIKDNTNTKTKKATESRAGLITGRTMGICSTGGYLDYQGYDISPVQALIPGLQRLLAAFRKAKFSVYHTREGHRPDLSTVSPREAFRSRNNASGLGIGSAGPLGRLLVRGEAGHDIIPELYPVAGEPVIDKPGRGAFTHTEFDLMLRIRGITNLVVAGVTTDCCVSSTIREATDRGMDCLLVEDGTAASEVSLHRAACASVREEGGIFGATAVLEDVVEFVERNYH